MALASTLRGRLAVVFVALLLTAPRALAEPVTHRFTGQLTTVTNGSSGFLDLTDVFSLGQAVTLEYTIERDTPPEPQDPYTSLYTDAITEIAVSVGTWSASGTPGVSFTTVLDDAPSPGGPTAQLQAAPYDQYSGSAQGGIVTDPLGDHMFQSLTYTLDDVQASVFNSTEIPREFPDLGAFEGKTMTLLFFNFTQLKSGYVMATLAGVTTPARATTWGGVKALYR